MIIDIHTHFFPERMAVKVFKLLCARNGLTPAFIAGPDAMAEHLAACGVEHGVYLPVVTHPAQQRQLNDYAAQMNGYANGRILCFGSVHPAAADMASELARIKSLGLLGVKLHPEHLNMNIDDEAMVKMMRQAAALDLPVLYHAGTDLGFPDRNCSPPQRAARLLDQLEDLPQLKLIAAHLGGYQMWDEVERYLVGRNIYLDTSFVAGEMPEQQLRRIIEAHGAGRILFGSDAPWKSAGAQLEYLRGLGLPAGQLDDILGNNAARLLGIGKA